MNTKQIREFNIAGAPDSAWAQLVLLREIAAQLAEIKELLAASTIAKSKE